VTTSVSTTGNIYLCISVAISVISVIGVFLSPYLNYIVQKRREARDAHKTELRKHVLKPLIRGIDSFWNQNLGIDEFQTRFSEKTEKQAKDYSFGPIYSIKASIPLLISISGSNEPDEWFDDSLYNDMKHHYEDLFQLVEDTEAFLQDKMPKLVWDRWMLTNELHKRIRPIILEMNPTANATIVEEDAVTGMLYNLLDYPRQYWPNLYNSLETLNLMKEMLNIVGDAGLREKGIELNKKYEEIKNKLFNEVKHKIEVKVISGKTLTGKCSYLLG
jgi:hypothetical protein